MSDRVVGEPQLAPRVRVAVEREQAPGVERLRAPGVKSRSCRCQLPSSSTATPRSAATAKIRGQSHCTPAARVEHAAARVAEDGDRRGADGSQHALGLILRPPQLARAARRPRTRSAVVRPRLRSRLPSAWMFASTPLNTRNRPASSAFSASISALLRGDRLHRHAFRDRQAVRVVGDPEAGLAQSGAAFDHQRAGSPRRRSRSSASESRRGMPPATRCPAGSSALSTWRIACSLRKFERSARRLATSDALAEAAIAFSTVADRPVSTSSRTMRVLDGPTNGDVPQPIAGNQIDNGLRQSDDRLGRPLVAERAPLGGLERDHVVEECRGGEVEILQRQKGGQMPSPFAGSATPGDGSSARHETSCVTRSLGRQGFGMNASHASSRPCTPPPARENALCATMRRRAVAGAARRRRIGFPAVHQRQREIHQDQVRKQSGGQRDPLDAVRGGRHVEAGQLEELAVHLARVVVVFDEQHERAARTLFHQRCIETRLTGRHRS